MALPTNLQDMTFNQYSTVLTSIVEQATGRTVITPTDTASFVSVGQLALLTGYDNVAKAISQVLSRTIFSIRPYTRKFSGLQVSNQRWGNHVRKLQLADKPAENDERQPLTDGASVDMYKINKPDPLQTNFYGQNVYQRHTTIFRDQLDVAFSNPEEFGRFITMQMANASDLIEQEHESTARMTLVNLIAGEIAMGIPECVVHLLTEYNGATGNNYDNTTITAPDVYPAFVKWAYARIASESAALTERSVMYHQNIAGKNVARHTPERLQKVFLYAPALFNIEARVLADTYHDNYIRQAYNEKVNFWQSIQTSDTISVNAVYLKTDGTLDEAKVLQNNVFGIIMDEEAAGYTVVNQWSASTPFNAAGGYSNIYWHFTDRYWNDFTENAVVFLMD